MSQRQMYRILSRTDRSGGARQAPRVVSPHAPHVGQGRTEPIGNQQELFGPRCICKRSRLLPRTVNLPFLQKLRCPFPPVLVPFVSPKLSRLRTLPFSYLIKIFVSELEALHPRYPFQSHLLSAAMRPQRGARLGVTATHI